MFRLALLLFVVIGASTAGVLITAVLAAGLGTTEIIVAAAAIGFFISIPISYIVARQLS